ncbi:hypothetical protein CALVIDRAFT_117208 [Calocera viscosa TUFC12733]|uniref:Uncharacterized protein n=1 Tax=Calocera viscosa (strain TUFC12733) TaxID=1330018 RepID=A0A167M8H6_CALVF|nr:hypothetical protein CALVIDRAFT_117208 [Calocera viscosa TUFC12733]
MARGGAVRERGHGKLARWRCMVTTLMTAWAARLFRETEAPSPRLRFASSQPACAALPEERSNCYSTGILSLRLSEQ